MVFEIQMGGLDCKLKNEKWKMESHAEMDIWFLSFTAESKNQRITKKSSRI